MPPGADGELVALGDTLNEMASQLEQSRGSQHAFLLSISHDLRTPLTSIRGYAEALADGTLDDADPDERKRAATVIGAEARRLERLVRDLLDLSRLDGREFSLSPRPCDLDGDRDATRRRRSRRRPTSSGSTCSALPGACARRSTSIPNGSAQIVANLVENALKYATSAIEVSATTSGDADHVAIVVTDDGPGIPAEDRAHVFERLYTARSSPGRSVGTGLGLAIVRQLADGDGRRRIGRRAPGRRHPLRRVASAARRTRRDGSVVLVTNERRASIGDRQPVRRRRPRRARRRRRSPLARRTSPPGSIVRRIIASAARPAAVVTVPTSLPSATTS